jgi:hypothetical protein
MIGLFGKKCHPLLVRIVKCIERRLFRMGSVQDTHIRLEEPMNAKFRNPLTSLIFSALLVTLFALASTPQMASARAYRPFVYDATGAMLDAIVLEAVPVRQPFYYDATAVMMDAITAKPVSVTRPFFYDATGAMLDAITARPVSVTRPYFYDATGAMLDAITARPVSVTRPYFYDATEVMLRNIVLP